jgi:repressor LexA
MGIRMPTEKQRAVLEFLWSFQQRMGRTPTGPEIATQFRFRDASSAYQHLRLLAAKGFLEIVRSGRKTPLAIRLTDLAKNLLQASYPLFGTIPAGPLEVVIVEADRSVSSVEDLIPDLKPGDYFLTVEGDSMIDAGLNPGMLVVIRPDTQPKTGDICAVWVEGEGNTLKRIAFGSDSTIILEPANSRYEPMTLSPDVVRVQGVLIASLSVNSPHR